MLPEDLLAEVDRLVGAGGRSAILAELVQTEIQRRKLLAALRPRENRIGPGTEIVPGHGMHSR